MSKEMKASAFTLDEADVSKIINNAPTAKQYVWEMRNRLILELLAFTGCRRRELVLLRFMDIDFERDMILMPTVKQEKRGEDDEELSPEERINIAYKNKRNVPIMNDGLRRDLKTYMELIKEKRKIIDTERLIQSRQSKSISEPMVNNIVAKAGENAGITVPNPSRKHIHPHMFRHTFVRYARKKGVEYKTIQKIIGHENISTTLDLYGDSTWDDIVEDMEKMKDFANSK